MILMRKPWKIAPPFFVYRRYIDFQRDQSLRDMKQKIERSTACPVWWIILNWVPAVFEKLNLSYKFFNSFVADAKCVATPWIVIFIAGIRSARFSIYPRTPRFATSLCVFTSGGKRITSHQGSTNPTITGKQPKIKNDWSLQQRILRVGTLNSNRKTSLSHQGLYDFCQILQLHQQKVRSVFRHFISKDEEKEDKTPSNWDDFWMKISMKKK